MSTLSVTAINEVKFENGFCKSLFGHESHMLPSGCQDEEGESASSYTSPASFLPPPFKFLPEAERLLAAPAAQIKLTEHPSSPTRCWEMKCVKAWRLVCSSVDWVR